MAKLFNRAKMSTATTGTGTITLGSASTGYQSFASAGVANNDVVSYVIEDNNGNIEFGTGTYTSSGTTLSRTVTQSCISGTWGTTAITLSGTANVFITALAADIVNASSGTATGLTATGLKETKTAPSISSGTLSLDCSAGNVFAVSLNANITTLSFTNVPSSGTAYALTLSFTADGTARTVTWGTAVKWPSATAPTLTSTNAKVDTFVLTTWDGGTTWYAFVGGQNQ